jgi:hypothetical protein
MNYKKTLVNLDKVLGIRNTVKIKKKVAKPSKPNPEPSKEAPKPYWNYAEVVNGRCAMLGQVLGPYVYATKGLTLYDQIVHYPLATVSLAGVLWAYIAGMSMVGGQFYNPKGTLENIELGLGQGCMLLWLWDLFKAFN